MNLKFYGAAFAAAMLTAGNAYAATLVVDNFSYNQTVSSGGSPATVAPATDASFIGGTRTTTVLNSAPADHLNDAYTTFQSGGGVGAFSNNAGSEGSVTLAYSGTIGNIVTGVDPYFFFDVSTSPQYSFDGFANFSATVTDTNGHQSTYSEALTPSFSPYLYFSQFMGNADFTSVASLSFSLDTTGVQYKVDGALNSISISAVPLPAGGLLLLSGLGGLGLAKRRRKAA